MRHSFLLSLFLFATTAAFSQQPGVHYVNSADYSKLKADGQLPAGNVIELCDPANARPVNQPLTREGERSTGCGCYIEPDGSYTLAMAPNDDGSSSVINLPFTFCLYGNNYTSLYINNNGNVSFGVPYGTFSASGFPSASFVMVAPFWADVDTRPAGGGQVLYKIYPNAIYVNWEEVGYYSFMTDKLNTFQLILSDGTDTTIGVGNNVAFCYQDMQWTTGSASSGVGGFGGIPANVGANKGDGINYIQFGRFDQPGTAYDGPVGANDGVSWLDNQSFKFSTCVTTGNVEPVFIDFAPDLINTSYDCGTIADTLKVCSTGDTLVMSAQVLDPNVSDIVTLTVSGPGITGFTVLSSTPGNPATITWQCVADPANYGFNTFTVTATDNGTPVLSASASVTVFIDTTGIGAFNSSISGDTTICSTETTVLSVPAVFDTYDWTTGSTSNTSGTISSGGDYFVTLSLNGCYKSISQYVHEWPDPAPPITGSLSLCGQPNTTLSTDPNYVSFNWMFGSTFVSNADTATFSSPGTVTLTVTDTNGCTGDSVYTIISAPTVNITGPTSACSGTTVNLLAVPNTNGTFLWAHGDTDSLATVTATGMYYVTFTDLSGCSVSDSQFVNIITTPNIFISTTDSIGCTGETLVLTVGGTTAGGIITWSTGASTSSINVTSGTSYSVTVNNAGCTDSDNITVLFSNPTVSVGPASTVCSPLEAIVVATGSSPLGTYSWSNGDSDSTLNISAVGTGVYTVTYTNEYGCTATNSQTATVNETPNIFISSPDTVVCVGETITLNLSGTTGGGSILWSNSATTSSINVTSGTTYSVTVDNAGCTDSDNITVVFNPNPTVTITGPSVTCANVPITLTANPSTTGTLVWSTSETTTSIVPTATGTYTVDFTDANGCTASDAQSVTINPVPVAAFSFSIPSPYSPPAIPVDIDFIDASTIAAPGTIVGYTWTVNDTLASIIQNPTYTFENYGVYSVTLYVISDQGCIDSLTQEYEVAPTLLIPNIFTPNSSAGFNDYFEIKSLPYFAPAQLKIFNRWGGLVYESSDYKNNWDGTKDGNQCAEDVYYYELILEDGTPYSGFVHLSRGQ